MNEMLHTFPERQLSQHIHQLRVRHSSLTRDLSICYSKMHKITRTYVHKSIDQSLRWINPCLILSTYFSKLLFNIILENSEPQKHSQYSDYTMGRMVWGSKL